MLGTVRVVDVEMGLRTTGTGEPGVVARGLVRLATRVLVHGAGRRAGCLGETLCSRPEPSLAGDGVDVEQVREVVAGRKGKGGEQSRAVEGRARRRGAKEGGYGMKGTPGNDTKNRLDSQTQM